MVLETEVLIVGAGPSGAALAGELGRRGIACIVLDATDGVFRDARLHNVTIRTMELARIWGIEKDLRDCGWPADHPLDIVFMTSNVGHELGRIPWAPIGETTPPPFSPTFAQRCPQAWFNPIMHRFAQRTTNVRMLWKWRFDDLVQSDDGVSVQATRLDDGVPCEIKAKFVVGCDGARSPVGKAAGIGRTGSEDHGHSAEILFRSAELSEITKGHRGGRYIYVGKNGISSTISAFDGRDIYRMTLMAEATKVTDEAVITALEASVGRKFAYEVLSPIMGWTNRDTIVDTYRVNRVFVAGDAAHTWPPMGGFGANTGVLDSFDLGWKLAAVLRNWGGPSLLDTYDLERRQHAVRMAALATDIFHDWIKVAKMLKSDSDLILDESPRGEAHRQSLGRQLTTLLHREFNSYGAPLGYRYSDSPVIIADGTPAPADPEVDYHPVARPGHLAPHMTFADGRATIDHFGKGFVLFVFGGAPSRVAEFRAAAASRGVPLEIVSGDAAGRALFGADLVLARPDGHVSWRQAPNTADWRAADILATACGYHADAAGRGRPDGATALGGAR